MDTIEIAFALIALLVLSPMIIICARYLVEYLYKENVLEEIEITLDENAFEPERAHLADAGYDLRAMQDVYIPTQGKVTIDTGVHIAIPEGYFGDIRAKSGLMFKNNIMAGSGTVDSGYRGAIKVRIINLGNEPYQFHRGDKIAQMVLVPCLTPTLKVVEKLDETERGTGGFGSTGK